VALLARPLSLHDVGDVEALARDALNERLRAMGAQLQQADYDDLLTDLIAVAWVLSLKYDRARSRLTFSTYAGQILRKRVVDWFRHRLGDSRYRRDPSKLPSCGEAPLDADGMDGLADRARFEEEVIERVAVAC
jgi:hypothetical protein